MKLHTFRSIINIVPDNVLYTKGDYERMQTSGVKYLTLGFEEEEGFRSSYKRYRMIDNLGELYGASKGISFKSLKKL
jgi:hypothetical protein